jgi:diacylglycerol kinase family enzyme
VTGAGDRARVGVITNPRSQKNKRGLDEMHQLLDAAPNARHAVLDSIADIPGILADFAREERDVVAVAGGDGTVQAALTDLFGRRPFAQMPLLAVVPRGMTNMIAADVGLKRQGLAQLLAASPAALSAACRTRRILRVENGLNLQPQYGMFFGGAGICRAIEACRTTVHPLKLEADTAAAVTLAGLLGRWLLGRRRGEGESDRIFYGDRITMTLDNGRAETMDSLIVLATTLDRLILRSRPFWGHGAGNLRFTAIAYPPTGLLRYARRLLYGGEDRKLPAATYLSRASDRVALAMDCPFTLDGEIYQPTPGRELILTADDEARFVRL